MVDTLLHCDEKNIQTSFSITSENVLVVNGEFTEAMALLRTSIDISDETGDIDMKSKSLANLVVIYHDLGNYERGGPASDSRHS